MECEEYGDDGKRPLAAFHASTPSRSKKTTSLERRRRLSLKFIASLRARRERPCSRRAAECGQQFPPSDGDCHAPLPCEVRKGTIARHEGCRLHAQGGLDSGAGCTAKT